VADRGAARSPSKGGIEVGDLDEEVSGELLLRIDVGAIQHLGLAVLTRMVVAVELG